MVDHAGVGFALNGIWFCDNNIFVSAHFSENTNVAGSPYMITQEDAKAIVEEVCIIFAKSLLVTREDSKSFLDTRLFIMHFI